MPPHRPPEYHCIEREGLFGALSLPPPNLFGKVLLSDDPAVLEYALAACPFASLMIRSYSRGSALCGLFSRSTAAVMQRMSVICQRCHACQVPSPRMRPMDRAKSP